MKTGIENESSEEYRKAHRTLKDENSKRRKYLKEWHQHQPKRTHVSGVSAAIWPVIGARYVFEGSLAKVGGRMAAEVVSILKAVGNIEEGGKKWHPRKPRKPAEKKMMVIAAKISYS